MPEFVPTEDDGSSEGSPTECPNGHRFGPDTQMWSDVGGYYVLCRVCGMQGSSRHYPLKWHWRQRNLP